MQSEKATPFHANNLGMAIGIVWALFILLAAWVSVTGWLGGFVEVMSSIYLGYEATLLGSLIGALWAFMHGYVKAYIVARVYNFFLSRR
jgi:hypothetical protein